MSHVHPAYYDEKPGRTLKLPSGSAGMIAIILSVWTIALALVSSGWLTLPAKDSDLQGVLQSVNGIRTDLVRIGSDVRSNREDLIRLMATIDERKRAKVGSFATTVE